MDKSTRKRVIRVAQVLISLVIVVGIFAFAIPKIANYGDVWRSVRSMTWLEITTLIAVSVLNILTYWPMMVASMPGLTLGQAAVNNQSSTSIANTLPGGGFIATGVSYTMYRSWGFTNTEIGLTTIVTGIWNSFIKLGMPILALLALVITGRTNAALIVPTVIGIGVLLIAIGLFAGMLWKVDMARAIGGGLGKAATFVRKWFHKPEVHWGNAAASFRKQTIGLVSKRWIPLTLSALASHIALYLVLLLALRHVGVSEQEISWAQVLGVFAFVRLISLFPLTPGGVGLVELGYIGGLYVAGKAHADVPLDVFKAQVTAAVLVFRTLTFVLQIPLGALTYVIWQRKKSWRKPVPHEAAEPAVAAAPVG
jgi:putative heme transporter